VCLWGGAGGSLLESWELYGAIRAAGGWPWPRAYLCPYLLTLAIRIAVGAGVAAVLSASGQITGAGGAALVGIGAPKILMEMAEKAQRPLIAPDRDDLPAPRRRRRARTEEREGGRVNAR
jgi:hypothetical protein